jgi:hypothetical protein
VLLDNDSHGPSFILQGSLIDRVCVSVIHSFWTEGFMFNNYEPHDDGFGKEFRRQQQVKIMQQLIFSPGITMKQQ